LFESRYRPLVGIVLACPLMLQGFVRMLPSSTAVVSTARRSRVGQVEVPDPGCDVVFQQTPVQLSGPHAEIPFLDPSQRVLPKRHPSGQRIEPVTTRDVRLDLGQKPLGLAPSAKGGGRSPELAVRTGVASLPASGGELANATEATPRFPVPLSGHDALRDARRVWAAR
jgi:hypothetical protein